MAKRMQGSVEPRWDGTSRYGRVLLAIGLLATGLVLVAPSSPAQAAAFTSIPERLYMMPAGAASLPGGLPGVIANVLADVPEGELAFDGSTDLIVGHDREIVVTATEGPNGCDLIDEPAGTLDYDIDDCTRVQLSTSKGRIRFDDDATLRFRDYMSDPDGGGPLTTSSDNPTDWLWQLPGGAVIDQWGGGDAGTDPDNADATDPGNPNDNDGYLSLHINGDTDMLNDALSSLVFIPTPGYHYHGDAPSAGIDVLMAGGDGVSPGSQHITIRVLDVNGFPSHDGPATFDAPAATEVVIPGPWTVADEDNDEDVDGAQADPPVAEEDLPDGAENEMLLVAWLTCGNPVDPGTGFHFDGAVFTPVLGALDDFITSRLRPTSDIAANWATLALQALEAVAPGLSTIELVTSDETTYTTAFAGVGTMRSLHDAFNEVTFRHNAPSDTCDLVTVVSDLGNNGLPVQWAADPPPEGVEAPMIGFDWNVLTITTGDLQEIDISFDSAAPIVVQESDGPIDVVAPLVISPADHPGFTITWDAVPRNDAVGDPPPGVADHRPGGDQDFFGGVDNTIIVPPGATTVPVPGEFFPEAPDATIFADSRNEGNETFRFELTLEENTPPDGWVFTSTTPTRTVVIIDDDDDDDGPREVVSVSDATVVEGDEPSTATMVFTVELDGLADGTESFRVDTVDGTATAPADYTALVDQLVTFPPGATSVDIEVEVIGDSLPEPDHTFTIQLSSPTNLTLGADTTGTGTIEDDDDVGASIADVTVAEGDTASTTATFTVSLDAPAIGGESVTYATADGTATSADDDYLPTTGTVTFLAGETMRTIDVQVHGDYRVEPDETFTVTLSAPVGLQLADASATGTITDDDPPSVISVADATIPEGTTGQVTVSMTEPTGHNCTVLVTTADGSAVAPGDYTALTSVPVVINGTATATIDITPLADADGTEGDEDFTLTIALAPASPADCALGDATATVTISDVVPDPSDPVATIDDVTVTEGDAGTSMLTFTVTLDGPGGGATLDFATVSGTATSPSDFSSLSGTLTFAGASTSETITVSVIGDYDVEPDETFTVVLSAPVGVTVADATGVGTIQNDDDPSQLSVAGATIAEGTTGQITVSMSDPTGHACTVWVTSTDGTATAPGDYTALVAEPVTLNGVASATLDLTALADADGTEGDETLDVTIALAPGSSANCALGAPASATVTITDVPPDPGDPTVTIADVSLAEGNAGFTSFVFTLTLSDPAPGATVDYATTDGTATAPGDYTATSGTLTFGGGTTATVTVPVRGETTVEGNETFTLTLSNPMGVTIADAVAVGTIVNDDVAADPNPLTITVPADLTRPNDPGQAGAVVTWPAPTSAGGVPPVTITCSPASGTFFPLGTTVVSCSATDSEGMQLRLGTAAARLTVSDTFTVTVVDVEPPSIADLPDLTFTTPSGTAVATFPLPAATDNSGLPPGVTCVSPSGTTFPLGVSTVTCTATDGAGNQASSSFTITVLQASTPTGILPQTGSPTLTIATLAVVLLLAGVGLHGVRRRT